VKSFLPWALFFICALVFSLIVDVPTNSFGLPETAVRILLAANLTLFVYLLARLVGKPMGGFLQTRRQGIASELAESARRLEDAESFQAKADERLRQVETDIKELADRAQREGEAEAEAIAEQANNEEARLLRRIEDELGRRQTEAQRRLAQETAALTSQMARELLERELNDEDRKRILERSLAALQSTEERG
jgi:F-type H+-transporting ATPase subunit b